jgi:serine/threonine protein kinase
MKQHRNPLGKTWCTECNSLVAGASVGDYVIASFLGQGTTSAVYLAHQPKLNNRKVVIKVLHAVAQESVDDFRREASVLAALSHPYILPIYAYDIIEEMRVDQTGNSGYSPYLVLHYAEQGSLDEVFKREGNRPWPLSRVLPILKEAAEALGYAHDRGILHRDVKPANILLFGSHIMLADFGVASLIDVDTSHLDAPWAGSPAYMAPEVWRFKPGRYSDQYALAVTCFRLLTGEYPWPLPTGGTNSWMKMHQEVPPRPLHLYRPDLPLAVGQVLQRALAKEPHDRYPSVGAFAADLRHAARDETQQLSPPPRLPTTLRPEPEGVQPSADPFAGRAQRQEQVQVEKPEGESDRPVSQNSSRGSGNSASPLPDTTAQKLPRDRWTLQAFVLNLVIYGLLVAVGFLLSPMGSALSLVYSLWPAPLIGLLVGRLFHRVSTASYLWGVLWGMIFGIVNALFSSLVCFGLLILISTAIHLNGVSSSVLMLLFFGGLWMSVSGGALIGLFAARGAAADLSLRRP